jgi:hypothetical protein
MAAKEGRSLEGTYIWSEGKLKPNPNYRPENKDKHKYANRTVKKKALNKLRDAKNKSKSK